MLKLDNSVGKKIDYNQFKEKIFLKNSKKIKNVQIRSCRVEVGPNKIRRVYTFIWQVRVDF